MFFIKPNLMAKKETEKEYIPIEKTYPSLILGLDISTACIGISVIYDDGENEPQIELISHVSPKINKNIKGIEALILRKQIFEEDFLNNINDTLQKIKCPLKKITDCVIESPMIYATAGSNANTVAQLLQFNGLLSEAVYRVLGIVPHYVSSYDARMLSFPELIAIRKFNKKGEIYPVKHFEKAIEENKLILFGAYTFDCDKKCIMMNMVNEKYPNIPWIYDKKGNLKKENYDSCDSLVCALAFANEKRFGELKPEIINSKIVKDENQTEITYTIKIWEHIFIKKIVI